jgi:integrase
MSKEKNLTATIMKKLKAGEKASENGLTFKRLAGGDGVFEMNKMVNRERIHRILGKESEGMTITTAKALMEKFSTQARESRLQLPKGRKIERCIADASKEYLERLETSGGKNLVKKEMHFRLHLNPFFGKIPLTRLSSFDVDRYKKERLEKGAKPATVNREIGNLIHFYSMAEEWGWVTQKPCRFKMLHVDNRRMECLTKDEAMRLLNVAQADRNPQIYLFIALGLETSMRSSEILSLRLEHIHLAQRQLFLPKAKAGARVQPITANVARLIEHYLQCRPVKSEWLFPCIGALPSQTGYTTRIGDPFKRVVIEAGLDPKRITPHVLRHTAISNLVMAGVDIPTIMNVSGHKTVQMVMRYSHQNNQHIQGAMNALESMYQPAKVTPFDRENYTGITHSHEFGINEKEQKPLMTRGKGKNKKYSQGDSNPCRIRERDVS